MNKLELQKKAVEVRKGIVTGVYNAKSGHPGGSLSAADLFTYLYFEEMNVDPKNPEDENRDRFVLSKGHTAPGYYAALALKGFFPIEDLKTLRHVGSYLQGHPDKKHTPGVDMSSGSLGQGLSVAVVWHLQPRCRARITEHTVSAVMERSRRDRYGRQLCSQDIESLTICAL